MTNTEFTVDFENLTRFEDIAIGEVFYTLEGVTDRNDFSVSFFRRVTNGEDPQYAVDLTTWEIISFDDKFPVCKVANVDFTITLK